MSDNLTFGMRLTYEGKAAVAGLEETRAGVEKVSAATSKMASQYSGLNQTVKQHTAAVTDTERSVTKLLDRYDPLGAKLRQLQGDFKALDAAASTGKIAGRDDARVDAVYIKLQKEIAAASAATTSFGAETASAMSGLGMNTQYARREMMMLGKEALTGDFARMPQTFASLATHSELLPALISPIGLAVAGVTAALAVGAYAFQHYENVAVESADAMIKAIDAEYDARERLAEMSVGSINAEILHIKKLLVAQEAYASHVSHNTTRFNWRSSAEELHKYNVKIAELKLLLDQLSGQKPLAESESALKANLAANKKAQDDARREEKKAIKASDDYIASLARETEAIGKNVYERKYLEAAAKSQAAATQAQRDAMMDGFSAWSLATQAEDENTKAKKTNEEATKAAAKLHGEETQSRQKYVDSMNNETRSLEEKTAAVLLETESIGKTKAEIDILQSARYDHETRMMKETLATYESAVACTVEAEALKEAIAAREAYTKAQIDQSGAHARRVGIDEETKAQRGMWTQIDAVAHDTFVSIFDTGKNAFDRLEDTLKNGLYSLLYQMTLKRWLINISAAVSGTTAAGMAGASGMGGGSGGAGAGSWLSGASSIYSAVNAGITTSISQGVAQVGATFWNAGAEQIGNAIMTNIAPMTAAISYLGAGMAGITIGTMIAGDKEVMGMSGQTTSTAGAIIGAIVGGPIGAAIGGTIGGLINAAFGMGPVQSGTTTLAGQFGAEGFAGQYQTPWHQDGGWFRSDRSGVNSTALAQEQVDAFAAVTEGTASVFTNLIAVSGDATRSLDGWNFAINRQVATQEQQNQLVIDMAESMGNYLIPSLDSFKAEGENLADTAVRMRDEFVLTSSVAALLGQDINAAFGEIGLASMAARDNLVQLMGGIQGMNATVQSYYQNFFSDTERHALELAALSGKFTQLGQTIPETRDGYRDLIEAQDMSTAAGRQMFAALMSLNGEFAALVPLIEDVTAATSNAAEIAKANLGWQQQIDVLQGTQTQRQVELANALDGADASTALLINQLFGLKDAAAAATTAAEAAAEAAALAKTNSGIQQQIDVLTGAQTQRQVELANALDGADASTALLINQLFGLKDAAAAAAEAQAIAQENLSTAKSDLLDAYNRESSAAQQLAERMTGFADGFNRLRTSLALGALSTLSPEAKYLEAKRQFEDVSRRSQLGDVAALGELENVSQSFLQTSRDYNASSAAYAADFQRVSYALQSSGDVATRQADIATSQVTLLQGQLSALGLINTSVLSVVDAMAAFAVASAAVAGPPPASVSVSSSLGSSGSPENNSAYNHPSGVAANDADTALLTAAKLVYQSATGGVSTAQFNAAAAAVGGDIFAATGWNGDPESFRQIHGFASGGDHAGGLRIVGERGWEMEATGASRIFNHDQAKQILSGGDNSALIAEIKLLRAEVAKLRAENATQADKVAGAVGDAADANTLDLRGLKQSLAHSITRMAA